MKIRQIADQIVASIKRGGTVFICGNGGSAAQAQHFAAELIGRYKHERRALPAIALTTDTSILTAIGNDYGFKKIFVRQLEALAKKGDVLITLSTSGKSPNVLATIEWGNKHGLLIFDLERLGQDTAEKQENHLWMLHKIAELVEKAFI